MAGSDQFGRLRIRIQCPKLLNDLTGKLTGINLKVSVTGVNYMRIRETEVYLDPTTDKNSWTKCSIIIEFTSGSS